MNSTSRRIYQQKFQSTQSARRPVQAAAGLAEQDRAIGIFLIDSLAVPPSDLRRRLEAFPAVHILGESPDASRALAMLPYLQPQLLIVDCEEQPEGGLEATRYVKTKVATLPIMVLSSSKSCAYAEACFRAGASGYCLRSAPVKRLVLAINSVAEGAGWIDPELSAQVLRPSAARLIPFDLAPGSAPPGRLPLSDRELEVLRLIAEGMSNLEIASTLVLSPETVKTHVKHIMEKLAASDRTQAVALALRGGLFT